MHGTAQFSPWLFAFMITTSMLVTFALHYYFWRRLARDTTFPAPWPRVIAAAIFGLGIWMVAAMSLGRFIPFEVGRYLFFIPRAWMGFFMPFLVILLAFDLFRLGWYAAARTFSRPPMQPKRRRFLARIAAAVCVATAIAFGAFSLPRGLADPVVKRLEVSLSRLPASFDRFAIVQITDLHLGLSLGREWVADLVSRVNALRPDLIAITGDLVDAEVGDIEDQVAPIAGLKAPFGVFFVTGNHEYFSGVEAWVSEVRRLGIRVLQNERVRIWRGADGFDLVGVNDFSADRFSESEKADLPGALLGRNEKDEIVLLAHQPKAVLEAAERDVGLVISGHTHGGQLWPITFIGRFVQPYTQGLHRHAGRTQIYVSDGTGYWGPPMRTGTFNEITLLTLRARRP